MFYNSNRWKAQPAVEIQTPGRYGQMTTYMVEVCYVGIYPERVDASK